jgi:hypothetical protein
MTDSDHTRNATDAPGRFHRLLDWSLFPASVAAVCVTGFSLILDAVAGRREDTELLLVAVAVVSAVIAGFVKRPR